MLVLSRYVTEKIYIGADIVLTVVEVRGGKVRLGIEAPRDTAVWRAELHPEQSQVLNSALGNKGLDGASK